MPERSPAVPAGLIGPPLHHHAFDEAFYILEGRLTFQLADEPVTAGPNTLFFAPAWAQRPVPPTTVVGPQIARSTQR